MNKILILFLKKRTKAEKKAKQKSSEKQQQQRRDSPNFLAENRDMSKQSNDRNFSQQMKSKQQNEQLPALRQLKDIADRSNPTQQKDLNEPWSFASMHSPKMSPYEVKKPTSFGSSNESKNGGLKQNNIVKPQSVKPEKIPKKESEEPKRVEKLPEKPKPFNFMPNPFNFPMDPALNFANPELFMHNLQQSQQLKSFFEQANFRNEPSHLPFANPPSANSSSFQPTGFQTPKPKQTEQKTDKNELDSKQMKNPSDFNSKHEHQPFDLNYHLMGKFPPNFPPNLSPFPFDPQMLPKNFSASNFPMMPNNFMEPSKTDPAQFNPYQKQFQMPQFSMPTGSMTSQPASSAKQFSYDESKRAFAAPNNPLAQFEQIQHQMQSGHFQGQLPNPLNSQPAPSAADFAAHVDALKRLEFLERERQFKLYSANMKI